MLVTADETGVTAGVDLRMVGGADPRKALLWQSRNPTGGVTCLAVAARPSDGDHLSYSSSLNSEERNAAWACTAHPSCAALEGRGI